MDRALAVVSTSDTSKQLVREAGELAGGVDAELVLLRVVPEDDYEGTRDAVENIHEIDNTYTIDQATEEARQSAAGLARDVLSDVDVEYEALGTIGRETERILAVAEDQDCDHVFVIGRKRSPTGKAIFGDIAQSVILNFDGPVTVMLEKKAE